MHNDVIYLITTVRCSAWDIKSWAEWNNALTEFVVSVKKIY